MVARKKPSPLVPSAGSGRPSLQHRLLEVTGLEPLAHRPPLSRRFWIYAGSAYLIPVVLQILFPEDPLRIDEMVWLVTLAPAFLLSVHYGLRGAFAALVMGTALFTVVQFVVATNFVPDDWRVTVPIYVAYGSLAISVGWLSEELHRHYRRAEETIKLEKAYLERLFESAPEAIVILNPDDGVERANKAFLNLFGFTMNEIWHRKINDLIVPEQYKEEALRLTQWVAEGEPIEVEALRRRKDGSLVDVSISGSPVWVDENTVAVYGIYRDITKRKKAESELREQEARYRKLVNDSPGFICSHDLDGTIISINPAAAQTMGFPRDEIVGRPMSDFLAPEGRAAFRQYLEHIQLDGSARGTMRFVRRDGGERVVAYRNVIQSDDDGTCFVLSHGQDITERVRAEQRLETLRKDAEKANLAKSRFMTDLSHELLDPLDSVLHLSETLMRQADLTGDSRDNLERIQQSGKRIRQLIDEVLVLSKIESGKLPLESEPIRVDELVTELIETLRPQVPNGDVDLSVGVPPGLQPISADSKRLREVLENLILNSINRSTGGTVEVAVLHNPDTMRPVRIDVSDSSPGIPAERLERVFEPFQPAFPKEDGKSGLGLSISRSLCDLMGFRLEVTSELGTGSTFSVVIPPAVSP